MRGANWPQPLAGDVRDDGQRRRCFGQQTNEFGNRLGRALDVYGHSGRVVENETNEPESDRMPVHERAEADSLHGTGNGYARSRRHGQQIRGNGSPTNMSMIRVPPNAVRKTTMDFGSAAISPIRAASTPSGCDRSPFSAASASAAGTTARSFPSFAI